MRRGWLWLKRDEGGCYGSYKVCYGGEREMRLKREGSKEIIEVESENKK